MVKILHFFKTYYPRTFGGIEQFIFQMAEGGVRQDLDSQVLYLSEAGKFNGKVVGGHLTHASKLDFEFASTGFSFSVFRDFAELASKFDIIHYHFPWPFMDMVHFASGHKKPTVVTYHSDIIKQKNLLMLYRPLMRAFLNSVDHIVATSPNYLKSSDYLSDYQEKVSIIPIGLDPSTYPKPSENKISYWQNLYSDRYFLFVGALRYYKGLEFLIDALKCVSYPVLIVGVGPLEATLKEKAKKLKIKNLFFLGKVSDEDKVALLKNCYALIFPSHLRSEAFGISLLEAAMYGKPAISCEIGTGTSYVNIGNETGLVVNPGDPLAIKNAMDYLWNHPVQAAEMGLKAKYRFEEKFHVDIMVKSYSSLYKSLV
ncbi:glycosyltransferase [Pseudomonas oryzihabitans]|uniref:glycosyltransferase n=1 Tax=Pseudomonas oryzihabitans TaxID=47885 RepID=UPI0014732859|nr:glycosyltransferase [Pseudomonas oryzihabitans]NMZ65633.1 glycosyltransferase [Pseudomonas oryzihabitans]